MTGLSQVFNRHISTYWEEQDEMEELSFSTEIPSEHLKKLMWIPDYVLKCFAYPQGELKLRVIQLVDDFLLPKTFTERTRVNGLLFLFHSLDNVSKEALRRLFRERAKCQDARTKFVTFKIHHRRQKRTDGHALDQAIQNFHHELSPLFSNVPNLKKVLEKLGKWKDHSVFKHLGALCDNQKSQNAIRLARDELVRCVGSRTALGEFLKKLCRKLALLTVNHVSIGYLLDFLAGKHGRSMKETRSAVELLVMVSNDLPRLFDPFIRDQVTNILVKNKSRDDNNESNGKDFNVILGALEILANYAQHWSTTSDIKDDNRIPSKVLIERLQKFCLGDVAQSLNATKTRRAAELAAVALTHFYGKAKPTIQVLKKLCSKEKVGSSSQGGVLAALQSLVVFSKHCSYQFNENPSLVSHLWTLLFDELINKRDEAFDSISEGSTPKSKRLAAAKTTEIRCLGLKVLVNLAVYVPHESSQEAAKLMKLLVEILRSNGSKFAVTSAQTAMFRLTASCGLLKMMRNPQLETLLSISEWHLLGLSIQDSSEEVRRQFLKKLTSHVVKHSVRHPHKYLSYLALVATETTFSLKKEARNILKIAVERMRRMFDAASENSNPDQDPNLNAVIVPEYALPYVIHLLAHHPSFPTNLVEKTSSVSILQSAEWSDQLAYLEFFLDGLVSPKSAADNIAFLLQMLTKLSQYHDVIAPNDLAMYPLIDMTAMLLKKRIKTQSDLKPFPGKIFLPKHLYQFGRSNRVFTSDGRKEPEAPDSLSIRSSRLNTSLSPIKPMEFGTHFLKLHSPIDSSLPSARKKRKRFLDTIHDEDEIQDEEKENTIDQDNEMIEKSTQHQSVRGQLRPEARTFADTSSDSEAESDTFDRRSLSIASIASSLQSIPSIIEEDENKGNAKKRVTRKGVATNVLK
ncbi:putative sister chromatid cohesion protein Pds5 [Plasmopara halstedii]